MRNLAPGDLVKKGPGSLQSRLARMLHHECDALEGYRFLGGRIVLKCFAHVQTHFQPSSGILTVAHMQKRTRVGTLQRTFLKEQPFASEDGMKLGDT